MKIWIIGLLFVFGLLIPSINCGSSDDDFEIKRFFIQSRQLNGMPHCIETRRKRLTREAGYIENVQTQTSSNEQDSSSESTEQESNDKEDLAKPIQVVIDNPDLAGSTGILIVQNPSSPSEPLLFAVRPVVGNSSNKKYLQMQIFDHQSGNDEKKQHFDSFGNVVIVEDFEDYMEDYDEVEQPKRQNVVNKNKKSKQRQSIQSQIDDSVKPNQNKSNRSQVGLQRRKSSHNKNRKNYQNAVQRRKGIKKNGNNNSDLSSVQCIVIYKEPLSEPIAAGKSSSDLSGEHPVVRLPNKPYGLRKRYKRRQV